MYSIKISFSYYNYIFVAFLWIKTYLVRLLCYTVFLALFLALFLSFLSC